MKIFKHSLIVSLILFFSNGTVFAQWSGSSLDGDTYRNGNVLIGTSTNPDNSKIYVKNTSSTTSVIALFDRNTSDNIARFGIFGYPDNVTTNTYLKNSVMLYASLLDDSQNLLLAAHHSNGTIKFHTTGYSSTTTERMRITATGNVGIGTTSPTAKLSVNGSANKPGGGSWSVFSDERLKTSIEKFKGGLDVIKTINPVWFEYNGKAGMPTGKKYVGTLAQELKEVAPYMVDKVSMEKGEYLTADYSALTFVLVNALKEQQQIIESLQEKVFSLENKVSNEKAFIEDDFFVNHSIKLSQNAPNPFNNLTRINYTIPDAVSKADIYIYDMQGGQVKHFENLSHENNYVELAGGELKAGIYHYALVVDGKEIDTKKLLLTK